MDVERLLLGVVLSGATPELSTNARLAVSAERKLRVPSMKVLTQIVPARIPRPTTIAVSMSLLHTLAERP